MKHRIILFLFLTVFAACRKSNTVTPEHTHTLPGTWQEAEWPGPKFAWTNYRIQLDDSGTYHMKSIQVSDMVFPNSACQPSRTEYSMGTYTTTADSIFFSGQFSDSTYTIFQPLCTGDANQNLRFSYRFVADSLILNYGHGDPYRRAPMYRN